MFSGPFIRAQAEIFFKQLQDSGEYSLACTFSASTGWLDGLKKRRKIKYKALRGSTDTINKNQALLLLDDLIKKNGLLAYNAWDIFNLDETALFWRTLAKRGLCFDGQAPKVALNKDRVTLVVAASLTGEKLPLCLIGTANEPNDFKKKEQQDLKNNDSLFYSHKKGTAWMTQNTFREYLLYLNSIFVKQNRHVVMLCDAPSVHLLGQLDENNQLIIQEFTNMKLIYLPSNCTALIQPCDQGIIRSFKARYRYHLLNRLCARAADILSNPDQDLTTFKINSKIKFKDCVEMSILAWSDINESVIVNAWVKSTIAAYWQVPKIKSTLHLHKLALKETLRKSKSIFKDLDVFNEFSVFEDMGTMDYNLMTEDDLREESLAIEEFNESNALVLLEDPQPSEIVSAPRNEAFNWYFIY